IPEALYKLAELRWEQAKAEYLTQMGAYQALVEACHKSRASCVKVPKQPPRMDLARAQALYGQLIERYPSFRKIDTVIYLYAFSLRDEGKLAEAARAFQTLIERFPGSRFVPDGWMAIAEHRFYGQQDFRGALDAYQHVLAYPRSQLYDLALFKTAWCLW